MTEKLHRSEKLHLCPGQRATGMNSNGKTQQRKTLCPWLLYHHIHLTKLLEGVLRQNKRVNQEKAGHSIQKAEHLNQGKVSIPRRAEKSQGWARCPEEKPSWEEGEAQVGGRRGPEGGRGVPRHTGAEDHLIC